MVAVMDKRPSFFDKKQSTAPGGPNGYVDVDRIEQADGLFSIISLRRSTGVFTFAIFKGFERDGIQERTNFIPHTMSASWLELGQKTIAKIEEFQKNGVPVNAITGRAAR